MSMQSRLALGLAAALIPSFAFWRPPLQEIPFVGCVADGGGEHFVAPSGKARVVRIQKSLASEIAFYKGERSAGVYAPRGWHCRVILGSGANTIVVTPTAVDSAAATRTRFGGDIVAIESAYGETPARFTVAAYASRVFPRTAVKFVDRIKLEDPKHSADYSLGPFPDDSIKYSGKSVATYSTPAGKEGLGTGSLIEPGTTEVTGVAVLTRSLPKWFDISVLRIRMSSSPTQLRRALLKLNTSCMKGKGC